MTRIHLERPAQNGPVRLLLAPGLLQPRIVSRHEDRALVALVAGGAMLLGGDRARVDISVAADCSLEIEEVGGTVAYPGDGSPAHLDVTVRLAAGARLLWREHPFVVAGCSQASRTLRVELGEGAILLVRETLVLGRSGESGGRLHSTVRARGAEGQPIFVEKLVLDGSRPRPGILGEHRVLDTALLLGAEPPSCAPSDVRILELEAPGGIARSMGATTHVTDIDQVVDAWVPMLERSRPDAETSDHEASLVRKGAAA